MLDLVDTDVDVDDVLDFVDTEVTVDDVLDLVDNDLRWANRQWPIASVQRTRSTLAGHSAVPHGVNVA